MPKNIADKSIRLYEDYKELMQSYGELSAYIPKKVIYGKLAEKHGLNPIHVSNQIRKMLKIFG